MVDEKSRSYHQTIERKNTERVRKEYDSVVMAVKNRVHDSFLRAMDIVVTPKFEKTVRKNSGSSSRRPNSLVHNHDWKDFSGIADNIPLMTASRRLDLNIDQARNIETSNVKKFEFPGMKS